MEIKLPGAALTNLHPLSAYVTGLTRLEGGNVFVVAELEEERPSLIRLSADGTVDFVQNVCDGERESGVVISKLVQVASDMLVLLGRQSGDGFASKIDGSGNKYWQKSFDRDGKWDFFIDAVAAANGGILVVGNSGQYDKFGLGPSDVWLLKLDSAGKVLAERTFKGRHGSVCRSPQGGYAVTYDESSSWAQDIWVRVFDANLEERSKVSVGVFPKGLQRFKIAAVPSGGYLVAGVKDYQLWLVRLNTGGEILWSKVGPGEIRMWKIDEILPFNGDFLVLFPSLELPEKGKPEYKVGLVRVSIE